MGLGTAVGLPSEEQTAELYLPVRLSTPGGGRVCMYALTEPSPKAVKGRQRLVDKVINEASKASVCFHARLAYIGCSGGQEAIQQASLMLSVCIFVHM